MEKQKILIADDSEMNRALLVDILEDQYDIVEADNGAAAIDLLTQCGGNFSLLLLDIMMPEMDGFEVLAYINSLLCQRVHKQISPERYARRHHDLCRRLPRQHKARLRPGRV